MAKYIYKKYEVEETQILTRYEQKEIFMREAPPTQGNKYFSKCEFDAELGRFHLSEERSWRGSFTPYDTIAGMTYIMGQTIFEAVYKFEIVIEQPSGRQKYEQYRLEAEPVYRTEYSKGNYIGTVTAEDGTYPRDGKSGSYWYVRDRLANRPPTISGSNLNIGSKTDDFQIEYIVNDPDGDAVMVDIYLDDVIAVENKAVTLGVTYKYNVVLSTLDLGTHKVKIVATDTSGAKDTRIYTFRKSNTAPVISGENRHLGEKSTSFSINYRVTDENDDNVNIVVLLNDTEISNITAGQDRDLTVTITNEQLAELPIGSENIISIEADDGQGGVSYRRFSFVKINRPPIISGSDRSLGDITTRPTITFSISDVEHDAVTAVVLLDEREVMRIDEVELGTNYDYTIPHEDFIQLKYNTHEIKILAWDIESEENKQVRKITFNRISNGAEYVIKIKDTGNTAVKKVIAVIEGILANDAELLVQVTNNYNDAEPTWYDMTTESKAGRAFTLSNQTKTAGTFHLAVKVTIENGESKVSSVSRGLKGGFE